MCVVCVVQETQRNKRGKQRQRIKYGKSAEGRREGTVKETCRDYRCLSIECCLLSGGGLCDGPITRLEES